MEQTQWLNEVEHRAWRALREMQWQLDGELSRRLAAESSLSNQDYTVLVVLTNQDNGALRLFELERALGWERSRVSHHVTRMASRGLVTKEKSPTDGRGWVATVTPHGRAEIDAAAPAHVQSVRELFVDHLTINELELIGDIAERVLGHLNTEPPPAQRRGLVSR